VWKNVNQQSLKVHQSRRVCKSGRAAYQTTTTNNVVNMSTKQELLELEEEDFPNEYVLSVNGEAATQCPVPSCPVKPITRRTMRVHFRNVHNNDSLIVEEEGPLPRCERCGLFLGLQSGKRGQTIR
jgi:hypothetical protein